ncbi:hypothetical protein AAHH84_00275 [Candidatus Hodgkinia cicadicola]
MLASQHRVVTMQLYRFQPFFGASASTLSEAHDLLASKGLTSAQRANESDLSLKLTLQQLATQRFVAPSKEKRVQLSFTTSAAIA